MKGSLLLTLFAWATVVGSPAMGHEAGAHVHGTATLQVTQDQGTLSIDLDSPLDSVLGFEHAPRTDKQKQVVRRMIEKFRHPEILFSLTRAAQCTAGPAQLKAPALNLGTVEQGSPIDDGNHAEIEVAMTFHCRTPAALKDIDVTLFDAFPGLRQLAVQIVGPRGQSAAKLTTKQRRFSW